MIIAYIKQNERNISDEKSGELKKFAEKFTDSIENELNDLVKDFNRIVDRYLTVPPNVPLYYDIDEKVKKTPQTDSDEEMEKRLEILLNIYKQQKILQNILCDELNFNESLDREYAIDSELLKLVELFMFQPNTDHMNNIENFLRNHDLKHI